MKQKELKFQLAQTPFRPLKLIKQDGTELDIPFAHVAIIMRDALLVFVGVKSAHSYSADRYELIPFERIDRIIPQRVTRKGRKAS